jgi:hypothetical protein
LLALRLRAALSVGRSDGARAILGEFAHGGFDRLPCDRDYLGTLGHLALAAATLGELEHARALYALLQPHADRYTADISLHSDGSVSHVLGLLARALDRRADAIAHFEHAIARNDGFGLHARAADSRYELAVCVLEAAAEAPSRARALLGRVEGTARALGLRPLLGRAQALARTT